MLDDAVCLLACALTKAHTAATLTSEVEYRPDRLSDEPKTLVIQRRRLIPVTMLSQSAEDKLALNRCIRKKLEARLSHISGPGNSGRLLLLQFVNWARICGHVYHYHHFALELLWLRVIKTKLHLWLSFRYPER
ncbi:hypothetical protein Zmor_009055 [Zophobas morio]|uniref:Uncharacterized protein n=1 Tax=Zophobas morio TaxID=2755281 RepID=A0AA38HI52_9CUCU|nr:hypothetical protein Zmor_009055 [Zophobas morio]